MKIMHYLEILSTGISVISLIIVIYGAIIAFCAFIRNADVLPGNTRSRQLVNFVPI